MNLRWTTSAPLGLGTSVGIFISLQGLLRGLRKKGGLGGVNLLTSYRMPSLDLGRVPLNTGFARNGAVGFCVEGLGEKIGFLIANRPCPYGPASIMIGFQLMV